MAFTLIVNPGSSSKKYALYDESTLVLALHLEGRGGDKPLLRSVRTEEPPTVREITKEEFSHGLNTCLTHASSIGVLAEYGQITHVGVRVVAPGTFFQAHRTIDGEWMELLHAIRDRAPLHIPHLENEIGAIRSALPQSVCIGVSDSAFHASMPPRARRYSIPAEDAERYDVYRFGYHGLSVSASMRALPLYLTMPMSRVIVCHVGSGVSVTAVKDGVSIDTTMGYAPLSGLVMSSRAGDIDASAVLSLMEARSQNPLEMQTYLQRSGGLVGLSGEIDLRTLFEKKNQGNQQAIDAIEAFVYHVQKAIGALTTSLHGIDALIFTGTAAERNPELRALMAESLSIFNIAIDAEKNNACVDASGIISAENAVPVIVIRTNEAEEILHIVNEVVKQ